MTIPTTDEMDKTTAEERYKLVAICTGCNEPHYFTGSKERFSQTTGEVCNHCEGTSFTGLQSQRTFNVSAARKRTSRRR